MKLVVQNLMKRVPNAVSAHGFGSFFRGEPFNDIDLVIVLDAEADDISRSASILRSVFSEASNALSVQFDLVTLTVKEFSEKPLREALTLLWTANPTNAAMSSRTQNPSDSSA